MYWKYKEKEGLFGWVGICKAKQGISHPERMFQRVRQPWIVSCPDRDRVRMRSCLIPKSHRSRTLILFVQTEGKVFSRSDFFGTVHFTDAPKDPRRSDKIAKTHSGSQTLLRIHRCSSKSTDAPRKFSKI